MARIRSIKPEFFKDEKVADLDPEIRLLFIGLWTLADRNGILEDRPRWIRAELFPYHAEFDVDAALHALARARMCVRYKADDGTPLIHITKFSEHQRPNSREPESKRPLPTKEALEPVACADARQGTSAHAHAQEEGEGNGGKAGKGNGGKAGKGEETKTSVEQARPSASDNAREIFAYWQTELNHTQSKLDAKREKAIRARLKEGYTVDRIKQAIRGIKRCPHNMGQNDRSTKYDDIELICRSGAHVDRFADAETAKPRFAGQERYENALLTKGGAG